MSKQHAPRAIRPYDKPAEPAFFGRGSYAMLGVIALLAAGVVATEPPGPPEPIPQPTAAERAAFDAMMDRVLADQRGDLATLSKPSSPPKPDAARTLAYEAAEAVGVDPATFHGLLLAENAGRMTPDVSRKGAIGPAQLMPATARELGVDPHDAVENVAGGALYLGRMTRKYRDETLALVAYNMGPGRTDRWLKRGGRPEQLPAETRDYLRKVRAHARKSAEAGRETQLAHAAGR